MGKEGAHRKCSAVWLWGISEVSKRKEKPLREKLKSQRDARWRCLNSRVQTFTKELSQQLTTEDINGHFISA